MKFRLKLSGYDVCSATNGKEALEVLNRELPDLIVLEIVHPKIDGLEVCRSIRTESLAPIIFLAASEDTSKRVEALNLGAVEYLSKYYSQRELLEKIVKILQ